MIKFFGKIRERLITQNRFSKYLLYAFGEIILVMIGILLALQVNNWNMERKAKDQESLLIHQLLEDAKADSIFFQSRKSLITSQLETFDQVLLSCEGELDSTALLRHLPLLEFPFVHPVCRSSVVSNDPDAYDGLTVPSLKKGLRDYQSNYEFVRMGLDLINSSIDRNTTDAIVALHYRTEGRETWSIADLGYWCNDEKIIGFIYLANRVYSAVLDRIDKMIEENSRFISELEKEVNERP